MYAVTMHGLFWNQARGTFTAEPTLYPTESEAIEAAQEDAGLLPGWPWAVVTRT